MPAVMPRGFGVGTSSGSQLFLDVLGKKTFLSVPNLLKTTICVIFYCFSAVLQYDSLTFLLTSALRFSVLAYFLERDCKFGHQGVCRFFRPTDQVQFGAIEYRDLSLILFTSPLQLLNQWPWPRQALAAVVQRKRITLLESD